MIKFDSVTKKYNDGTIALEDISFEVDGGEFVFITGPSGAGKTSLLRLVIREDVPSLGEVFVDSEPVSKIKNNKVCVLRRKVGVVFQDFKLIDSKTAYENVAITLEAVGKNDKEIDKSVKEMLEYVGLQERMFSFPRTLSGGEKQRVAIARALVHEPKILLADEPTGMIDPSTGWEIFKLLDKINKWGTTVVIATHNLEVIKELKRRNITINHGKIVSDKK